MNGLVSSNRGFTDFDSIDEILAVLRESFRNRKLHIRYGTEKREVSVSSYNDDGTILITTDPECKKYGECVLYGLSDKYIEVDLRLLEEIYAGYFKCEIVGARKATKGRRDLRFLLQPGIAVATNFKLSKHTIELSKFNIPTGIKVVLDQFQSANSNFSDHFKVDILGSDVKDEILKAIKNTGKTLFVADCSDINSYKAIADDFLDPSSIYGSEIDKVVRKSVERGLKSIAIVPVIYTMENGRSVPFAYIRVVSKTKPFGLDKVLELKEMSFKLVERIRDANTLLASVHQEFVDISKGGAKLKITDSELKKYIEKSGGFIFDIVFKLQAPITVYGEVKNAFKNSEDELIVGVYFGGNSSRKGEMERFYDVLKPMELEYKENLIRSIKSRQRR